MIKETAKQEVEQVCFAYEKAGKTGDKKDWKKFYKLGNSLIAKIENANQPKLSIPKKIAELINTGDTEYIRWSFADDFIPEDDFAGSDWEAHEKREKEIVRRKALVSVYLAGKALGVELVEVEG